MSTEKERNKGIFAGKNKPYFLPTGLSQEDRMEQNRSIMANSDKSPFVRERAAGRYLSDAGLSDNRIINTDLNSFVKGEDELAKLDASRVNPFTPSQKIVNRSNKKLQSQVETEGLSANLLTPEGIVSVGQGYGTDQIQLNALAAAAGSEPPIGIVDNPEGLSPLQNAMANIKAQGELVESPLTKPEGIGLPERQVNFERGGSVTEYLESDNAPIPEGLVEVPGSGGRAFVKPKDAKTIQSRREADFYRDTLASARKTGFAEDVFDRIQQTAAARREARGLADIPTEGILNSLTEASNLSGTALTFGGKRRKEAADTIIDTFNTSGLNVADLSNAEKQRLITIKSGLEDPMSNSRREAAEQLQGLVSGSMLRRADEAAGRVNEDLAMGDTEREIKRNQLIVQELTSKFVAGETTPEETQQLGRAMKATAIIRDIDDPETQKRKVSTAATYLTTISATGQRQISSLQDQLEETDNETKRAGINSQIQTIQDQVKAASDDFMEIYKGTNLEGLTANDLMNNTDALKEALEEIEEEEGLTDTTSKEEPPEVTAQPLTLKQQLNEKEEALNTNTPIEEAEKLRNDIKSLKNKIKQEEAEAGKPKTVGELQASRMLNPATGMPY